MRLHEFRNGCDLATWRELLTEAQRHSLGEYLLQDSFPCRSFDKPRGYSGGSVLLNLFLGRSAHRERSLLGQDAQADVFFGRNRHIVYARITRKS